MEKSDSQSLSQEEDNLKISELVDIHLLKDIFDKFTQFTGLTIGFLDYPEMNIIIASGWKDICTKFHRSCELATENCMKSNAQLLNQLNTPNQLVIEKCANGLYDCATPIFINGKYMACLTTGQMLLEQPDLEYFRNQAKMFGFDEEEYLKAVSDVKIISEKELLNATSFLGQVAAFISESGYNNLIIKSETKQLEHEISERIKTEIELRESREKSKMLLDLAPEAFFQGDPIGSFIEVNEAAIELTGYSKEELLTMNMKDLFPKQVIDEKPLRYDVLQNGVTLTNQRELIKKSGEVISIEMSSRSMPDGTYQCFAKDITLSKKAQEELNRSESRLRKFFECAQEGLIFHDKGIIVDANTAYAKMYGFADESVLIGKNLIDYIAPESVEKVKDSIMHERPDIYEAIAIRKDGTTFPIEISPQHAEFGSGRRLRISSVTDISERKKTQKLQEINSQRTRALLALSQMHSSSLNEIADFILEEVIRLTGSEIGYLAFLNEKEDILTMHAWSDEAMAECKIKDFPRDFPLAMTGLWGEAVRQRKPIITNDYQADNPYKKGYPAGHIQIRRHLNVPVFDGDRIVAVIGVGNKEEEYYDECVNQLTILGKAMWTHIDRQRMMKELIESREQFRLITENSNDMIIAFDLEIGTITYVSPGSGKYAKWEPEEVKGHSVFEFVHEEEIPMFMQIRADIFEGHDPSLFKHRILMKDGTYSWFETSCQVVQDEDANKIKIVAVCRDISEKVKTEQLQKEKEVAEAASKAKSEFLANVSHEIRNPLNSIVGLANTLSRSQLSGEIQEIVNAIKISSGNLLNIINDVLDLSKIEANRIELENSDFEIGEIFRDVYSLFKATAEAKGIIFNYSIDGNVPSLLKGDAVRFKQMVVNLTGNAIKFTDSGSVLIKVSAHPDGNNQTLIVTEVSDTGIGIQKEDFSKLFKSFSQLDSSTTKKYSGTGLGLAIVKNLAEMMGGEIFVESDFGKGSTFSLKIPFFAIETKSVAEVSEEEDKTLFEFRVLLVEDDALNQMYLKGFLTSKGMLVDSAFNGLQALEKYDAANYDIILMDGQMPIMDGFEATKIIREKEKQSNKHTPIIAITGYAIAGDNERFLSIGMDSYITKPFDENKLIREIGRLVSFGKH